MWIDDDILRRAAAPLTLACWTPERAVVVLGSSNRADTEVDAERCALDKVEILKRYGGGGTVVLHPGCVVVSVGAWVRQHFENRFYFGRLNQAVISALAAKWPALAALSQNGLSDITHGDRKVAGTSLFRSRNYLLYQASILVEPRLDMIEKYLRHPSKEPDYRQGRSHRAFLTGLAELVHGATPAGVVEGLHENLPEKLEEYLAGELIDTQTEQIDGLLARAARG